MTRSHLDIPIFPGARQEWAQEISRPLEERPAGDLQNFYLVRLGAEWFGLPPTLLVVTLPSAKPCRLPHRGGSVVEGVVNSDGKVILCISLERLFGVMAAPSGDGHERLIVAQGDGWTFAFQVREVGGVEELETNDLQALSGSASEAVRKCARGTVLLDGRAIICLDQERFVHLLREVLP